MLQAIRMQNIADATKHHNRAGNRDKS